MSDERKKSGGLDFMALRFEVIDKRRELRNSKKITPAEYFMLEEIELGTIGARNARRWICSKAEFFLQDLASILDIRMNKVYVQLKLLEQKDLIVRERTRSKGREILGLNPKMFGQVLIDKSHQEEKMRHLKLVPNLAVDDQKEVPNQEGTGPESGLIHSQFGTSSLTNRDQTQIQPIDIIEENSLLDSYRTSKTLKGENSDLDSQENGSGYHGPSEELKKMFPQFFGTR